MPTSSGHPVLNVGHVGVLSQAMLLDDWYFICWFDADLVVSPPDMLQCVVRYSRYGRTNRDMCGRNGGDSSPIRGVRSGFSICRRLCDQRRRPRSPPWQHGQNNWNFWFRETIIAFSFHRNSTFIMRKSSSLDWWSKNAGTWIMLPLDGAISTAHWR